MLKPSDKAIYTWVERPIFEHKLCGYKSNANPTLKYYTDQLVTIIGIYNKDIYTQCTNCATVYPIEEQFKEFNILVKLLDDTREVFMVVSEKELEVLDD